MVRRRKGRRRLLRVLVAGLLRMSLRAGRGQNRLLVVLVAVLVAV